MNFITSNKGISVTVIVALALLGFFYIAGATKKTPIPDGNIMPRAVSEGTYSAFQGVQASDAIYLKLKLVNGAAELTSVNLAENKSTIETGTFSAKQTRLSISLTNKDGKAQPSVRTLEFDKLESGLKLTNNQEAGFGPEGLTFYMPTQDLANTSWYWEKSEYANDKKIEPSDKDKFKLTFKADGSFDSSTDCNSLSGRYFVAGSELKLGGLVSTLMVCDGSLEPDYAKDLREIYTYMIEDGKLILTLPLDSGSMQFVKAQN